MSVNTWEEFCQYIWEHDSGTTTLYTEVVGDTLYYYLNNDIKHERYHWLNISSVHPSTLSRRWHIVGQSPIVTTPMTQQERVCKKIAVMEARWKKYQETKGAIYAV